jgi:EpsI family protein
MNRRWKWVPAIALACGALLTMGVGRQRSLPLAQPLATVVPAEINGYVAQDVPISDAEARVAGFSDYLFRTYEWGTVDSASVENPAESTVGVPDVTWFTVYVGYYESQAQGNTIHSPKNCLPGAGWEALSSKAETFEVGGRAITVNRYLIQNESDRALVLYWYQGRGRIASNEYRVKVDLLLDAALRRRSDEALVRIVVPVGDSEEAAMEVALAAARIVAPSVDLALPEG